MKSYVQLFKTLADETRLRILMLLYAEVELCVCDIISTLLLPQSTVSRHLAYLKKEFARIFCRCQRSTALDRLPSSAYLRLNHPLVY